MTEHAWRQMVVEWRNGTQSARAFALARGVAETAFRYWVRKMGGRRGQVRPAPVVSEKAEPRAPALARVVRPVPQAKPARVMVMVGRAMIAVEPGFDAAHLRDVVRALGELT